VQVSAEAYGKYTMKLGRRAMKKKMNWAQSERFLASVESTVGAS
jgi:hypothetical protein